MEQNILRRRGVGLIGVDKERVFPGYTLFAPLSSSDSVYLVDNDGKEVHKWTLPYRPGRHARILGNGNLAVNCALPDEPHLFLMWEKYRGGAMLQVDPEGNILREHRDPLAHHDAHHMENGHILYATLEELSDEDGAKVLGGVPGSEAPGGKVYADVIKEVDENNKEIWSWSAFENLPKDKFPLQAHYPREHYPLINTVYPLRDGNILASFRSVSAVVIIEKATGKIIWHLDYNVVAQQHNANELENGNILIFDNGAFRTGDSINFSRVIEVRRDNKEIVWEYRDRQQEAFFTPFMGSAQRLANGNTLINEAAFGRIFEVTEDGTVCWEYVNPYFAIYKVPQLAAVFKNESNALFRAYKYSKEEIPWLNVQ
jgi:hypothetical protein